MTAPRHGLPPELDREPWARMAVFGRLVFDCAARSDRNAVSFFRRSVGLRSHAALVRGLEALEWVVIVRDAEGKARQSVAPTLEDAFERAWYRLQNREPPSNRSMTP